MTSTTTAVRCDHVAAIPCISPISSLNLRSGPIRACGPAAVMCGGCLTDGSGRGRLALRGPRLNRLWTGTGTRRPALRQTLRDRPLLAPRAPLWHAAGRAEVAIARRRRAQPGERMSRACWRASWISSSSSAMPSPRSPSATTPFHAPHRNRPASRVQSTGLAGVDRLLDLRLELRDQLTDPGADARRLLVDVGSVGLDAVESEEAEGAGMLDVEAQVGVPAGDDLLRAASAAAGRRCAGSRELRPPTARYSPSLLPESVRSSRSRRPRARRRPPSSCAGSRPRRSNDRSPRR